MEEVKWIKLCTDVFDNRKIRQIESLPNGDTLIVIWFKLLTLAGVINDGGAIYFTKDIPYTDQLLSTAFNRPLATIQLALSIFQQFGMISVTDSVIQVSNWEKYQNAAGLDKIREQTRKRVARHREKQKMLPAGEGRNVTCNATVTQGNATEEDTDIEEDIENEERNTLTGIKKESEEDASLPRFRRPTLEEVTDYCEERGNGVDPQRFISYYESVGWKVGKTPMKDWRAAVRTWEAKEKKKSGKVYDHGDIAYKAARALAREVSKRLGVEFREAVLQDWAAEIEACSKEYGNSIEDMAGVMEFSQTDEFWSGIILDGYKFRAKYPQLVAAMQRSEGL